MNSELPLTQAMEDYLKAIYRLSQVNAGERTAAFAVAAVLARLLGGMLADHIAPKYVVLASLAGITVQTSGYSSYQVSERDRPARWRVSQSITLEGRDFAAMTNLVSALQSEVGLVIGGIQFSVSDEAQREEVRRLEAARERLERERREADARGASPVEGSGEVQQVSEEDDEPIVRSDRRLDEPRDED